MSMIKTNSSYTAWVAQKIKIYDITCPVVLMAETFPDEYRESSHDRGLHALSQNKVYLAG